MCALDPEEYQELLNAHDTVEDVPVHLSRYQAQKCGAIISAGRAGHVAYAEASGIVARYLQALAFDTLAPGVRRVPDSSDALWQVLDDLPWPSPGPPARQPS